LENTVIHWRTQLFIGEHSYSLENTVFIGEHSCGALIGGQNWELPFGELAVKEAGAEVPVEGVAVGGLVL
jgi:hypothetical protein